MKPALAMAQEAAEALALQALTYIAGDGERLGAVPGRNRPRPGRDSRAPPREPGFLPGVLDYLAGDEALLTGFAQEAGFDPFDVGKARLVLGGDTGSGDAMSFCRDCLADAPDDGQTLPGLPLAAAGAPCANSTG